jgi:DNA-binding ferritin-like protein
MNSQEIINETVKFFFTLQLNIKVYHWNTTSYARHKASDEFGGKLASLIDRFVEVFIGRYKVKPFLSNIKIDSDFLSDDGSIKLLNKSRDYLEHLSGLIKDTDLLTIRDELLSEVNQTLYLYQLK